MKYRVLYSKARRSEKKVIEFNFSSTARPCVCLSPIKPLAMVARRGGDCSRPLPVQPCLTVDFTIGTITIKFSSINYVASTIDKKT